jgi:hypothetical protein
LQDSTTDRTAIAERRELDHDRKGGAVQTTVEPLACKRKAYASGAKEG